MNEAATAACEIDVTEDFVDVEVKDARVAHDVARCRADAPVLAVEPIPVAVERVHLDGPRSEAIAHPSEARHEGDAGRRVCGEVGAKQLVLTIQGPVEHDGARLERD